MPLLMGTPSKGINPTGKVFDGMSTQTENPNLIDDESSNDLATGTTLLHGQYVIEEFLNDGGFGITYLANDSLDRQVVIKECFPKFICGRNNGTVAVRSRGNLESFKAIVDLFIKEARNLAKLSHPNIVGVHQVFEDNDTAYMAMDFVEGRDLLELADSDETIDPQTLESIAVKLLDAIDYIHKQGILHRDISPDNVLLTKDFEPVLIDFGAARETATQNSSYLAAMRTVKDGYSPQEFYVKNSEQHQSSDLYSLAASLYHVMTGEIPVNAQERMTAVANGDEDPYVSAKSLAKGYSASFLDAIDAALQLFPADRTQTAEDWLALIQGSAASKARNRMTSGLSKLGQTFSSAAAGSPNTAGSRTPSTMSKNEAFLADDALTRGASSGSNKGIMMGVIAAGTLAFGVIGMVALSGGSDDAVDVTQVQTPASTQSTQQPTATPTTTDTTSASTEKPAGHIESMVEIFNKHSDESGN